MANASCTAIIPADRAAVVYTRRNPARLITKNAHDGEIVKLTPHELDSGATGYSVDRRHENGVSWWQDGGYRDFLAAHSGIADRQAFGFRYNDEPATLFDVAGDDLTGLVDTFELEPLENGAVIIDGDEDLPLVLHTVTGDYWRLHNTGTNDDGWNVYTIDHKPSEDDDWTTIETLEVEFSVVNIIDNFAEYAQVLHSDDVSATAIHDTLDNRVALYEDADFPLTDTEQATRAGMPTDTLTFQD